jgi:adenylyltransferase/sulfurtransferase
VRVRGVVDDLAPENIAEHLGEADLILDGTDNFETRYLINDYCVSRGVPWIYGAAVGSYGIAMPVLPGHACFRCVYPEPPGGAQPTCETAGVLGSITASIAAIQVAAALRWIARGDLEPRITTLDVWTGGARSIEAPARDPDCPACAKGEYPYLEGERRAPVSLCGRNAVQIHERGRPIDLHVLKLKLAPLGEVRANEFGLRFFFPPYEMTVFPDGRAIVKGSTDPAVARSLYARFIGA